MFKLYLNHLKTISKHKYYVAKFCFKCGFYWRGITHDLSKYGITEFCSSAKYFSGKRSPIDAEKDVTGYSIAWQHHKGHNPHHECEDPVLPRLSGKNQAASSPIPTRGES